MSKQYRLITRSDMDGLVCAVLLKDLDLINDIKFVHPKDMQDAIIDVTSNDITTNLPYVKGVHIAFDHHFSESIRNEQHDNHIIIPDAPSAARVVYEYYTQRGHSFPTFFEAMMVAVDKADSAQFSKEDILNPKGWDLLSFLMDARTGLGRFREFRVSNYQLMMDLIDYCKTHEIVDILNHPDVKERVDLYKELKVKFDEQLQRCSTVQDNLVILDLRKEETIYPGNRFAIYALYPQTNISIHILWGFKKQNTVFATANSIISRTSKTNVGELMLKYGGGGHENAGTCQIDTSKAEGILKELVGIITSNG